MKKIIKAIIGIIILALTFLYVKNELYQENQIEETPISLTKFDEVSNILFNSQKPISRKYFNENFGEFFMIAENMILKKSNIKTAPQNAITPEIIRKIAKEMNFEYSNEVEISTSSTYYKNDNIDFSKRPYNITILAQYNNQSLKDKQYYADTANNYITATYKPMENKIDFPISINGKSLWTLLLDYIEKNY